DLFRLQFIIYLDCRAAGDGGGDVPPDIVKRSAAHFLLGDFEYLENHLFDCSSTEPGGRGLDGDGPLAKRFCFKATGIEFFTDALVFQVLSYREIENNRG